MPKPIGTWTLGVLQSFDSGVPYEAVGQIDSRPYVTDPGYANEPARVPYYFTERGAFRTDDVHRTDLNLNWALRIPGLGQRTELFLRATVLNVFDNQAVADNNDNRHQPGRLHEQQPRVARPIQPFHGDSAARRALGPAGRLRTAREPRRVPGPAPVQLLGRVPVLTPVADGPALPPHARFVDRGCGGTTVRTICIQPGRRGSGGGVR